MSYSANLVTESFRDFVYLVDITLIGGAHYRLVSGCDNALHLLDLDDVSYMYVPAVIEDIAITETMMDRSGGSIDLAIALDMLTSQLPGEIEWVGDITISRLPSVDSRITDKKIIYRGRITGATYGDPDEPVVIQSVILDHDVGYCLPIDSKITSEVWPDVGRSVQDSRLSATSESSTTSSSDTIYEEDDLGQYRAYQSSDLWPGEIIGYPSHARCVIVEDVNDPEPGVGLSCYLHVITTGSLKVKENRSFYFKGANREKFNAFCYGNDTDGVDTYIYTEIVNDQIHTVTRLREEIGQPRHITMYPGSDTTIWPSSYTDIPNVPSGVGYTRFVYNLSDSICGVGLTLQPGDHLAFKMPDFSLDRDDYRMVLNVQPYDQGVAGCTSNIITFRNPIPNVNTVDYVMPEDDEIRVVPAHSTSTSCWLRCDVYGGIVGPDGNVLRAIPHVLSHLHARTEDVKVDFTSIDQLPLYGMMVDGQILDGELSPSNWIAKEILSLFPLVAVYTGDGLHYEIIDYLNDNVSTILNLSGGVDGHRLDRVSTTDPSTVINSVKFSYGWNDMAQAHLKHILMSDVTNNTLTSGRVQKYSLNSRAVESKKRYGKKHIDLASKFINDDATASYIVNSLINNRYRPRKVLKYKLRREFNYLNLNDVCEITDSSISIDAKNYLIVEITRHLDGPTVTLHEMG